MTGTALSAQMGFVKESTAGTRAVPTRFLELATWNTTVNRQTIRQGGMRAGRRRPHRMRNGGVSVGASGSVVLAPQGLGALLELCLGAVNTTGSGPYTHVFTDGALPTGTFQVGLPRVLSTTVDPVDIVGGTVTSWSLAGSSSDTEELRMDFEVTGMSHSTAQSLASASYPTGYQGFTWTEFALTIGGSATEVIDFSITGNNGVQGDRFRISGTNPTQARRATQNDYRTATATINADYSAATLRDLIIAGTEGSFSAVATSGSTSLTIAGNVKPMDNAIPQISGPGNLVQPVAFEFVSGTSDAAALTVTLVNADSAP